MLPEQMHSILTATCRMIKWHVPVFYMITGYLWFSSDKVCTYQKVWPNIRKFILVLLTIGFAYAIMERFYADRCISFELFLYSMCDVLTGKCWDHMWYMYSIIGVYLILPALKPFFRKENIREITIFTGIIFLFEFISPIIEFCKGYSIPIGLPVTKSMFYLCAGGLFSMVYPERRKARSIATVIFSMSSITVFFLVKSRVDTADVIISLFSCVSAVSLFIGVVSSTFHKEHSKGICAISDCTFGIYLIHPLFINIMAKVLHIYPFRTYSIFPGLMALVTIAGLSLLTVYILRKNKNIKEYLL